MSADPAIAIAGLLELPARVEALTAQVAALRDLIVAVERRLPPMLGTDADAARVLRISVSQVRRLRRAGKLPVRMVGRRPRIDLAALRPLSDGEVAELAEKARRP